MISKLVLGTVQLGLDYGINNRLGKPTNKRAFEILEVAYNNGITILDTAEAYGNSQQIIGDFLKNNPEKKFKIITKLAANSTIEQNFFMSHIERNCSILHVNSLYGYMFHSYQSFKNRKELHQKFVSAKEGGLINKIGVSLYSNHEIEDVLLNYSFIDFIQIPFNIFDNSSKRKFLLDKAKQLNIEVHTRSAFLQGLFFKDPESLPKKLNPLRPYLKVIDSLKERHNFEILPLALQYVLQKEYIDHVLIGVDTPEQLTQNIEVASKYLNIPHFDMDNIDVKETNLLNPSNWN